ncbi:hypothetical protein, partial [Micrococcus sp. F3Y]|uniref:hypothetical protein n=1 Tax=Micrococcus sp. F3Y TaxID=3402627 RepID=UPI003AF57E5C
MLQAIANECDRRGHEFALRSDGSPTFQITAQRIAVGFELLEELESRTVVDEDELAVAKYPWQRVRSAVRKVPSGRLVIRTGPTYSPAFWADRKRWSLAGTASGVKITTASVLLFIVLAEIRGEGAVHAFGRRLS